MNYLLDDPDGVHAAAIAAAPELSEVTRARLFQAFNPDVSPTIARIVDSAPPLSERNRAELSLILNAGRP